MIQRPQQRSTRYIMEQWTSTTRPRNLYQIRWQRYPPSQYLKHEHQDFPKRIPRRIQHFKKVLPGVSEIILPQGPSMESKSAIILWPSKVGFIMYITNTLQVDTLIKNVLEVINK